MFSRFFIDRPIFAAVISVFLVLAGARAGVLKYLAGRLRTQAPQDHAADAEFVRALEGVEQTVAAPLVPLP